MLNEFINKLTDIERKRIQSSRASITSFLSSEYDRLNKLYSPLQCVGSEIKFYEYYIRKRLVSDCEMNAMVLHEIGHLVNLPPDEAGTGKYNTNTLEEELYADYYSVYCGYKEPLLSAIKKMCSMRINEFETEHIKIRINELASKNTKVRLNLKHN